MSIYVTQPFVPTLCFLRRGFLPVDGGMEKLHIIYLNQHIAYVTAIAKRTSKTNFLESAIASMLALSSHQI